MGDVSGRNPSLVILTQKVTYPFPLEMLPEQLSYSVSVCLEHVVSIFGIN